jgi:5'-deoxynucleotidase YfbR-like HD superfamily hydrolase
MNRKGDWISTYSATKFYAFDPRVEEIHIEDIAHALSLICRYSGHCKFFYSVAQHSIGVQQILKEFGYDAQIQLYGLLHDASEAYICDIPKDIKRNMPEYKKIEKNIQNMIWKSFNLPEPSDEIHSLVKQADNMMLRCEAKTLMKDWTEWYLPYDDINIVIEEKPMKYTENRFLQIADILQHKRNIK